MGCALLCTTAVLCSFVTHSVGSTCNVRGFGARGDGKTLDTQSIQRALDQVTCDTVLLPGPLSNRSATYLTGSLRLRSHLVIEVAPLATLLGANASVYDYPEANPFDAYQDFGHSHWHNALLWGEALANVTVSGGGTIDGGGGLGNGGDMPDGYGDKMFSLKSCRDVRLTNLTLRNTGHFGLLATNVSHLELQFLDLFPTRDGVDLVGCSHVFGNALRIEGGGDDAFVLKSDFSLGAVLPTKNVTLQNSSVSTDGATALEIGSETVGDFDGIRFRDISVHSAGDEGIGMAIMDGGAVRNVEYRNIAISGAASPVQFYIGARQTGHPPSTGRRVGSIRDVQVINVTAHNMSNSHHPGPPRNWTAMLDGMPAFNSTPATPVGPNISFHNVSFRFRGGGTADGGNSWLEPPHPALGWSKTGPWPSYAWYIRRATGVTLDGVQLLVDMNDDRPAIVLEDAVDVQLRGVNAQRGTDAKFDFDVEVRAGCSQVQVVGGNITSNLTTLR